MSTKFSNDMTLNNIAMAKTFVYFLFTLVCFLEWKSYFFPLYWCRGIYFIRDMWSHYHEITCIKIEYIEYHHAARIVKAGTV